MLIDIDLSSASVLVVGHKFDAQWAAARLKDRVVDIELVTDAAKAVAEFGASRAAFLVDASGGDAEWKAPLRELSRGRVVFPLMPAPAGGHIVLVGAGPGDPRLHSVRARYELFCADIVFVDRLAGNENVELMQSLAPAAQIVDVGKEPDQHRVGQREIEQRMLTAARAGLYVVRLKGGDPFVFGRGSEELVAAREAGIPVTVVPGITSAVAVPEAVGIPVTEREIAASFTVLSGHEPLSSQECEHLVGLGGTIVILMGVRTFEPTMQTLVAAGMDPQTPFVIIERGYAPTQRVVRGVVGEATACAVEQRPASPAVIVIGAVTDIPALRGLFED